MTTVVETFDPQVLLDRRPYILPGGDNGTAPPQIRAVATSSIAREEVSIRPRVLAPPLPLASDTAELAAVIQIWEGTVLEVDRDNETMSVTLLAKIGEMPTHTAEISLDWVSPQDLDLVEVGAIFYLTLSRKLTKGKSRQNAEELRFRRLPSWSTKEATALRASALELKSKFRAVRFPTYG